MRPESAKEAQYVHDLLTEKGIIHETLSWTGQKPETGIEEKARQARYELLFNACRKNNISCLFLAHHQNDQAETFLMRLVRSSGVDGLSAIQSVSSREGIFLLRPMLDYSRLQIQETLKKHFSVSWVEDPSNNQIIYERVRLRQAQDFFDNLGLTASSISLSAKRLSRARFALEKMARDFISQFCRKNEAGFIFIESNAARHKMIKQTLFKAFYDK